MHSLRGRLVLSHILPLLLVLPLLSLGLLYLVETQILLADLSRNVSQAAHLIVQNLAGRADLWDDPSQAQAFVTAVGVTVDGQVVLLRSTGQLLAVEGETGGQEPVVLQGLEAALQGHSSVLVSDGLSRQKAEVLLPVLDADRQLLGIVGVVQVLEGAATRFARLRQFVLAMVLAEVLLGALVGYLLALRMERPISRVASTLADITQGRQVQPLPVEGPDELRQLSASANALAQRLRALEDIRQRSLANIVHELGRPLGAIRSAVHVLRGRAGDDPEIREELLAGVETQVEAMQPLLDDLAQLHGQVQGQVVLNRHPLSPSDWLASLLLPWQAAALEKGLDWQTDIPAHLPVQTLDPDRMAQAVGNLLSNAVKYTPAGGTVSVAAGEDDGALWIRVADTGPGIAADELEMIFEPFYRSQRERRFPQGLGLGLTIARNMVQAHGGRLEVVSTPGQGSRFTIVLPHEVRMRK